LYKLVQDFGGGIKKNIASFMMMDDDGDDHV
jgi:hypothetical protein